MAHLPEQPEFEEGIYQIERTDPVVGGVEGISNRQARQLGNRTQWLRQAIEQVIKGAQVVGKATRLATARKIRVEGDASGEVSFDGSTDVAISLTLADSGAKAGTYPVVTLNAKGLATGGRALTAADIPGLPWGKITSGKPTTLAGYGITDALPASSFNWLNLPGKPGTFPPSPHTHPWGSISATPTTLAGYGITDVPELVRTVGWRTRRAAEAKPEGGDFDLITAPGCHDVLMHGANKNGPGGGYYYVQVFEYGGTSLTQLLIPYTTGGLVYRHRYGGKWSDYSRILDTDNFTQVVAAAGHSHAWGAITGKPTTLGGYGITDAFPRSGGQLTGPIYPRYSTGSMAQGFTANAAGMEVRGVAEAAAFMSFHRPGYFAAYFGLDVDNKFKIGGWSMGALAYELVHEGNSHLFNGAPGQVAAFAGAQPPAGWLKANGAAVSRATYARLFAAIGTRYGAGDGKTTFNLPDLRGEFIRGWDDARGLDASRGLGSVQSAMLGSHGHTATAASAGAHTHAASCDIAGEHSHTLGRASNAGTFTNTPFPGHSQSGAYSTSVAGAHAHTISVLANGAHTHAVTVGATGGHETRPRNIALLYCIKY